MLSATLPATTRGFERTPDSAPAEDTALDTSADMDSFLASVERRAYRIAQLALRDADEALDIVQDAMIRLVRRYSERPAEEWRPLFYRILQNRIRDVQRRNAVRARVFAWRSRGPRDDDFGDPTDVGTDPGPGPGDQAMMSETMQKLQHALDSLPRRQQQAFLLRNFEGLSVAETAAAMSCSEGSVKTHYSRAVHSLRAQLGGDLS